VKREAGNMTEHLSCKTVKIMKMFSKRCPLIYSDMGFNYIGLVCYSF